MSRARGPVLAGVLALALGAAAGLGAGCGGDGGDETVTVTDTETVTQTDTVDTATETTAGQSGVVTQGEAIQTAKEEASIEVDKFGIGISPDEFTATCETPKQEPSVWDCQVNANGGQCSGVIRVEPDASGKARAARNEVGCGE